MRCAIIKFAYIENITWEKYSDIVFGGTNERYI